MRIFLRFAGFLLVSFLLTLSPLAGQEKKPAEKTEKDAPKGDAITGKKLYKAHCAICHFADASIDKVGPGMKSLFHLKKLSKSGQPATEESIRKIILDGAGDPKMPLMPHFRDILSPADLDDLVAYLKTL
ncbi:MAG: c-type cytochrome [Candidatus Acidiferrales bacterium]